ncbi:MAG: alpha/beta fold hydrolase [Acidimicrobiia bacterium]|nr:alpha/beta fold hydrolase [Acidimicrobiia bacterium]
MPEHATGTFRGAGGLDLAYRSWAPGGEARATVVLVHGLGEHSGRYEEVAAGFAAEGYATWALDHRGHGRSEGRRGHVERFSTFVADLETFRLLVAAHQPGPQVLLGHSLGGAIALAHALGHPGAWAAVVLSGPAVGATGPPARAVALLGRALSTIVPAARVLALDAAAVSRDPAVVADYRADPLVHHGRYTARLAAEVYGRMASFAAEVPSLHAPLLIVHGTEDSLVPVDVSRTLLALVGSADKSLVEYPGLYHEVFNEPEGPEVLQDVLDWVGARVPEARRT